MYILINNLTFADPVTTPQKQHHFTNVKTPSSLTLALNKCAITILLKNTIQEDFSTTTQQLYRSQN